MTQQEHLDRIVAKCRELLAIAEKRTAGKWMMDEDNEIRTSGGASFVADCYDVGGYDSAYITACAGTAEAGWRATIAAIAPLIKSAGFWEGRPNCGSSSQEAIEAIIAAWPEELL